jgi:hypothetical protein
LLIPQGPKKGSTDWRDLICAFRLRTSFPSWCGVIYTLHFMSSGFLPPVLSFWVDTQVTVILRVPIIPAVQSVIRSNFRFLKKIKCLQREI